MKNREDPAKTSGVCCPTLINMLLGIDFMQENGVQLHCSTGEFRVGACLTIQSMFKANSPSVQAFSARHVRLPPLSVEVIDC